MTLPTCKHCGEALNLGREGRHGPVSATRHTRYRNRLIQHLKDSHPDIAATFARGFTRAKGFRFEEHLG